MCDARRAVCVQNTALKRVCVKTALSKTPQRPLALQVLCASPFDADAQLAHRDHAAETDALPRAGETDALPRAGAAF